MNSIGRSLRLSLFGTSHGPAVGCVLEGLPSGLAIDEARIAQEMELRRPHVGIGTARREADEVKILSGVMDSRCSGAPLTLVIENRDVDSSAYDQFRRLPRPGHADMPALAKYSWHDIRGGGQFSGRLTAPLVAAGAVVKSLLEMKGVEIGAFTRAIGGVEDPEERNVDDAKRSRRHPTRACNAAINWEISRLIEAATHAGDSVGGVVECLVEGLPVGVGEPWFDGLDARLAQWIFSIPAVKGLEFGDGFDSTTALGSENNDPYHWEGGKVRTSRNAHGGVLGGLSSGMPLKMRIAFKPTPSIGLAQETVDLESGKDSTLQITGRHDPCIVPRAVAVVEAVTALALTDLMMEGGFFESG